MLNKNDIIEINIDGLGYNGEGIAHYGGYTVFIKYALPQERVRAQVILVKPTFAVAKLDSVLTPSPYRVQPFCPVYYKCGGCSLQHISYERQLRFKTESVAETFYKAAKMRVNPLLTVASPQKANYRNKMSLPVRGDKIGFFAQNSHRVIDIQNCPIQFGGNGELIAAFKNFMTLNKISGYNETENSGAVRHLIARKAGGVITVTAVVNGSKYADKLKEFSPVLKEMYGNRFAYYINVNTAHNNVILGDKTQFVCGNSEAVTVDGLKVTIHPQSFFQVNDGVRELIYKKVAALVDGEYVYDCYSGGGILSAMLACKAKHVTAIEIEPKAVDDARAMLKNNAISNVTAICGDCAIELPQLLANKNSYNVTVVIDPPRAGCDERVTNAINNSGANKIVYVSCNPATLARDCARLTNYTVTELAPFDMFPQTPNVETVATLVKNK